jgi:putative transposase
MQQVYRHNPTSVSLIHYHFLWVVRRKSQVLRGMVAIRLKELISEVCETLEVEVLTLDLYPNAVYLLVSCPPTLAPHQVVHRIKGYTARYLRREFEPLQTLPSMWTRSYFVSTAETIPQKMIKQYISRQKKRT